MRRLGNISMKVKLIVVFLIIGIVPLVTVGWLSSSGAEDALMKQSYNQLEAVRDIKKNRLQSYFREKKHEVGVLMDTVAALQGRAFESLSIAQELKKAHLEEYMHHMQTQLKFLRDNPKSLKAMQDLDRVFERNGNSVDTAEWEDVAENYDAFFQKMARSNGWHDLFLIHKDGDIVYTVAQESDLGMTIPESELKDSGLGKAFARIQELPDHRVAFVDFAPYAPADDEPVAFLMAKLVDRYRDVQGYIAIQAPTAGINKIVQSRAGMGKTGETFVVGEVDGVTSFRSDLRTIGEGDYTVGTPFRTDYIDQLMQTQEAFQTVFTDAQGDLIMVAASPLAIGGVKWGMVTLKRLDEVIAPHIKGSDYYSRFIEQKGFDDLFLIHPQGRIFYTVAKEADYGTNLIDGEFASSNLGELFRSVMQSKTYGFADYAPYAPGGNAPAAFIAQPYVEGGEVKFVVALQLSLKSINEIMTQRTGMGDTGETYLVGPDKRMRSNSNLDPEGRSVNASFAGAVSANGADTEAVNNALAGESGAGVMTNYTGAQVLSEYTPLNIENVTWALVAETDLAEVEAPVTALHEKILWNAVMFATIVLVIAFLVALSITRPLAKTVRYAKGVAAGMFDQTMPVRQKDEIGQLAQAVEQIPNTLKAVVGEVVDMADNVKVGKLRARGQAEMYQNSYAELVETANDLTDVLVGYLDDMPSPLMVIDKDFEVLYMNKNGAGVGARTPEEVEGGKCFEHFNTSDCRTSDCACARAMQGAMNTTGQTDAHPSTGDLEIVYSASPITDRDGNIVAAFEIITDQTEVIRAKKKMEHLAGEAVEISSRLSSAAEQLSAQVEQSSRGAEVQRDRAAETATAMEQMNATVLEVAQNATSAAENAEGARVKAQDGAEVVNHVVESINQVQTMAQGLKISMDDLGGQAEGIGRVMNVITDIADQTNLLALNAAIEAARAGEAGRGFAVVADEVRKLAEKTMAATREVGDAIASIQQGARSAVTETEKAAAMVVESTTLATNSGEALRAILELAEGTADQVRAIATASDEQSAASEQVTRATDEINTISMEASQTMTESEQAVREVATLAQQLNTLIDEMQS